MSLFIGQNLRIKTVTANYTAVGTEDIILVDATSGAVTVTLPSAIGISGKALQIKKIDSSANAVTINTTGGQLIDLFSTFTLLMPSDYCDVCSSGTNWYTISSKGNAVIFSHAIMSSPTGNPQTSETKVTWSSPTVIDTRNGYDNANSKYVIPERGYYICGAFGEANTTVTGIYTVIKKNGTAIWYSNPMASSPFSSGTANVIATSKPLLFAVGDYLELYIRIQGSGTPVWAVSAGVGTGFSLYRI